MAVDAYNTATPTDTDKVGSASDGAQVHLRAIKVKLVEFRDNFLVTPFKNVVNTFTKAQVVTPVTIAGTSGSLAIDASLGNIFRINASANITLANPTNLVNGQALTFRIKKNAVNISVAFGSKYRYMGSGAPFQSFTNGTYEFVTGYWDSVDDLFHYDYRKGA